MARPARFAGPGPANLDEARRLVALYVHETDSPPAIADAVAKICGRIIEYFDPLIGARGTQALLVRAVYLSKPWSKALEAVPTREADADVARDLLACLSAAERKEALGAAISVLGAFVELLTRFIGEDLGLRLLRDAFPDGESS